MKQDKNQKQGSILIMSVMALLALTAGVFLLQSTQTAQTRISQTDNKLMEEYEMKRTLINRTALDYRKYILYENGTINSLISSCVKSTNTFDSWKTGSYNGLNYSVSACDNTDADTNYTSDTDEFLWFKIDATYPDGRARTYYALMEPGEPNGCELTISSYLDQYASENSWNLKQGATTVASRTFTSTHNYTTQSDPVLLQIGVPYVFTYNDSYGDGFAGSSFYFRMRNDTAAVNIFNKTDATSPSSWYTCTANITMTAGCTNTTTVNCGASGSTPTPTPTPTPSGPYCYDNYDCASGETCVANVCEPSGGGPCTCSTSSDCWSWSYGSSSDSTYMYYCVYTPAYATGKPGTGSTVSCSGGSCTKTCTLCDVVGSCSSVSYGGTCN